MLIMWIEDKFMDTASTTTLLKYAGDREVLVTTDLALIQKYAQDIDIVLGDFPKQYLSLLPNLVWFQQFGTGVEWLQEYPELIDTDFTLTNCSDSHHDVVADHALALILSVIRGIPTSVKNQQHKNWYTTSLTECDSLFQLRGKTVLVIGLGSVGLAIVQRLKAFGANIIGVRKNPSKTTENVDIVYKLQDLPLAVAQANMVISTLPKTHETNELFNIDIFNAMKKPSFFFNVGRGNAVNEHDLATALNQGILKGAGIDVSKKEPLSQSSFLWSTKNLLITPHSGGTYNDVIITWRDLALNNLVLFHQGAKLRNQVVKSHGY
ncbi:D-2-hydroxyacid dehydrogenase [Paraglaciecola aquimarina]|uniref:D-2-hydroxyacid dehydrogenase n=1 Tax=Paraglaciecola algarum TaxID=3050085 RepID=A0ABS9D6N3_9ALTE|nr:D-2-hydroxyacid dehydrogenase [Paraglaciecola sp. G1-23]MCF2947484.1 D-2-hydroxyacid dehydrogenase [Paraglaciecola sp. G1-23]